MELVKKTEDYVVYQKKSKRYAVKSVIKVGKKSGDWINGDEKTLILIKEKLITAAKPKPKAEKEAEAPTEEKPAEKKAEDKKEDKVEASAEKPAEEKVEEAPTEKEEAGKEEAKE